MKSLTQILHLCIFFTGLLALTLPVSASTAGQVPHYQAKILADIEELKQKLANNENDALIHYKIGELYLRIPRLPDSIAAFEQAVQIKPDFAAGHYRLGWTYINMGKYEQALEAHEQALILSDIQSFDLKITRVEAQFAVGWNYYHLKRFDEAIAAYQATLQLDPGYEDALYEIGRVQIAQGNPDQAMQTASRLTSQLKAWLMIEQSLAKDKQTVEQRPLEHSQRSASLKPTILYKEKPKYTDMARKHKISGIVRLNVVFAASGQITNVEVISGLPYGLTAQAIIAAHKIRFQPAQKDGQPISVSSNLEFSFNIY